MKRIIALTLCLILCMSCVVHANTFKKGTQGTFFTTSYDVNVDGYDHIYDRYYLTKPDLESKGPKAVAMLASQALEDMPEGRRILQIHPAITHQLTANLDMGVFVSDSDYKTTDEMIDSFFKELAATGAKLDYVFDDFEAGPSVFYFENKAIANFRQSGETVQESYTKHGDKYEPWIRDLLIEVEESELYKTRLRPMLEDAGFVFGDDYDLKYINIFPGALEPRKSAFYNSNPPEGAENAYNVFSDVVSVLARQAYEETVYNNIKEYYPDIKFSNWGFTSQSGVVQQYDLNGNYNTPVSERPLLGANYANIICYSNMGLMAGFIEDNPPEGWRYEKYPLNAFSELFVEYITICDMQLSDHRDGFTVWISTKDASYYNTDYYCEMVFHTGMFNPDPYLYWAGGTLGSSNGSEIIEEQYEIIDKLLSQLDDLVGFEDRKSLLTEYWQVPTWDQRYLLSGMSAGGKNVWRITPDLYTPGVSMENFLVNKSTPKFRIGNQCIDFPAGSYIYEPEENLSQYGYWVISPEGTRPKEYRVNNIEMPAAPAEPEDGFPVGSLYSQKGPMPDEADLANSKDRMEAAAKNPSGTQVPDEDANVSDTEQEYQKTELILNPMKGTGDKVPLVTDALPADVSNHWAKHTLANMFAIGVMKGTGSGMMPDSYVTKAEFLTMLERILGAQQIEYTGGIADVSEESWYADVINTAVVGGWIETDSVSGNVYPETKLTRAAMCMILDNALNLEYSDTDLPFTDSVLLVGENRKSIAAVSGAGLIMGYDDGSFAPYNLLTRAETAVVFERLLNLIPTLFGE